VARGLKRTNLTCDCDVARLSAAPTSQNPRCTNDPRAPSSRSAKTRVCEPARVNVRHCARQPTGSAGRKTACASSLGEARVASSSTAEHGGEWSGALASHFVSRSRDTRIAFVSMSANVREQLTGLSLGRASTWNGGPLMRGATSARLSGLPLESRQWLPPPPPPANHAACRSQGRRLLLGPRESIEHSPAAKKRPAHAPWS
jgi:hypothetical protein